MYALSHWIVNHDRVHISYAPLNYYSAAATLEHSVYTPLEEECSTFCFRLTIQLVVAIDFKRFTRWLARVAYFAPERVESLAMETRSSISTRFHKTKVVRRRVSR